MIKSSNSQSENDSPKGAPVSINSGANPGPKNLGFTPPQASGYSDTNKNSQKIGSVLVVGGGIAGIQSALDLAESGYYVHLVEASPSIGGTMGQLDKTFPTNDCSMCILSPKLVEAGRHLNINLITNAQVKEVKGEPGNFIVTVNKKPTYVDPNKCTGCGVCTPNCPVEMPNEFDIGLSNRKAIYIPFPQAVPLKYAIDKRGTQPCIDACPAKVGAAGYVTLVARGKFYEALKVVKERLPFTSVCGRICHRPCENACPRDDIDDPVCIAHIKRFLGDMELKIPIAEVPALKTRAEKIAIVGGGPAGLTAANDLAKKGYHVTVYESSSMLGGMLRYGIPAFRLPKKILDNEIMDIIMLGVRVFRNTKIGKDLLLKDLFERGHQAVFIATGAQRPKKLNVPGEKFDGVFQAVDLLREINVGKITETPIAVVDKKLCSECGMCADACVYKAIEIETPPEAKKKKRPKIINALCKGCGKCAFVCPTKAIK